MKRMKKLLSVILALTMVLSTGLISVTSAEESNLVLDLDFSGTNGQTVTVKDTVGGATVTVGGTPLKKTEARNDGTNWEYADFDGTNTQYIKMVGTNNVLTNLSETTVSMWIKFDNIFAWDTYTNHFASYSKYFNYGGNWKSEAGYNSGEYTSIQTRDGNSGNVNLYDHIGNWVNLVFTRSSIANSADDGKYDLTYKLYLNGVEKTTLSKTAVAALADSTDIFVGGNGSSAAYDLMDGGIADFKIYNKVLTASEISAKYTEEKDDEYVAAITENQFTDKTTTKDNVKLDIDFYGNEGNSVAVVDAKGTTLASTPTRARAYTFTDGMENTFTYGKVDDLAVNGTQSVSVNAYTNMNGTSIAMWINMTETEKWPKLFNLGSGKWKAEYFANSESYKVQINTFSDNRADVGNYIDEWTYLVFTRSFDGATISYNVYANGNALLSSPITESATALSDSNSIVFGGNDSINNIFYGGVADIKVYDKVLTTDEMAAIYEAQRPKDALPENEEPIMDLDFGGEDGEAVVISDDIGEVAVDITATNLTKGTEARADGNGNWNYADFEGGEIENITIPAVSGELTDLKKTSVSMWINFGETIKYSKVFKMNTNWRVELGDKPYFMINGFNGTPSTAPRILLDSYIGKWTHVVLTRELGRTDTVNNKREETLKAYFDGVEKFSVTQSVTPEADQDIIIGNYGSNSDNDWFDGKIADVKLYETALTQEKITEIYEAEKEQKVWANNLMLDLSFTEENGAIQVTDSVTPERSNIKVEGTPAVGSYSLNNGDTQSYASFSGDKNQYILIDDSAKMELMNHDETTVEMLLQIPSEADFKDKYRKFFAISGAGGGKESRTWWSELGCANSNWLSMYGPNSSDAGYRFNMSNKYGKWVHLVSTRKLDKTNSKIIYDTYIDGVHMETSEVKDQTALNDGGYIYIGGIATNGGTDYYKGGIASFKLYNKALTTNEIANKYNASRATGDLGLMVDIDIENYTSENTTLTNKTGLTTLWYNNITPASFTNEAGDTVNYVEYNATAENETYEEEDKEGNKVTKRRGDYLAISTGQKVSRIINQPNTTVEMWVQLNLTDYPTKWPKFFAVGSNTGADKKMWWAEAGIDNGKLIGHTMGKNSFGAGTRYSMTKNDGNWSHFIFTRSFDEANTTLTYKTYLDGKLVATTNDTTATEIGDAGGVYFGEMYWQNADTDAFIGGIAEAKMYNTVLTEAQVKAEYEADKAKFKTFDDIHTILDVDFEKGVDKAGTATGIWTSGGTASSFNNGNGVTTPTVAFAGDEAEYYAVGGQQNSAALINLPETTVDMWVKFPKIDEYRYAKFFSIRGGSADKGLWLEYGFQTENKPFMKLMHSVETTDESGNPAYVSEAIGTSYDATKLQNSWGHIVVTRKFDTVNNKTIYGMYINGEAVFEGVELEGIISDETDNMAVSFGGNHWNAKVEGSYNDHFQGEFAKAKMYDVVLDATKISEIYASEVDLFTNHGDITANISKIYTAGYDDDGNDIEVQYDGIGNSESVTVELSIVSTYIENKNATVYAAYYENGRLSATVPVLTRNVEVVAKGETIPDFTFNFGKLPPAGSYIKLFVWSADEFMKPYASDDLIVGYTGEAGKPVADSGEAVYTVSASVGDTFVAPSVLLQSSDGTAVTDSYYDVGTKTVTLTLASEPTESAQVVVDSISYDSTVKTVYTPVKNALSIKSIAYENETVTIEVYNPFFTASSVKATNGTATSDVVSIAPESVGTITVTGVTDNTAEWSLES